MGRFLYKNIWVILITAAISIVSTVGFMNLFGTGSDVIKVKNEVLTKGDLLDLYKKEYGTFVVDNYILNMLWSKYDSVSDKEYEAGLDFIKQASGVETEDELKEQANITGDELKMLVKSQINQLKHIKKELNITKDDIEQMKEKSAGLVYVNSFEMEGSQEDKLKKILSHIDDGKRLEDAAHKEFEEYHLSYKWEEEMHESELRDNEKLKKHNDNIYILKENDKIIIYEIGESVIDVENIDNDYYYIALIAKEEGFDLSEKTNEMFEEFVEGYEIEGMQ